MLFNNDECEILQNALETYLDNPRGFNDVALLYRLVSSSLQKLSNISPLTHFTKQELSVMAISVRSLLDSLEVLGYDPDGGTLALNSKLLKLL